MVRLYSVRGDGAPFRNSGAPPPGPICQAVYRGKRRLFDGLKMCIRDRYTGLRCTLPLDSGPVRMEMVTEYPREGRIRITVLDSARFTLRLRIPAWCREWRLLLNGERTPAAAEKGFAALERSWQPGDCAVLELEMPCRRVYADPRAYHLAHQTAVIDVYKRQLFL